MAPSVAGGESVTTKKKYLTAADTGGKARIARSGRFDVPTCGKTQRTSASPTRVAVAQRLLLSATGRNNA